jgi:hypothetical protein
MTMSTSSRPPIERGGHHDYTVVMLGRAEEAEAEARRAYKAVQGRPGSSTTRPARTPR